MEKLHVAKTNKSPEMIFNTNGMVFIWGRSLSVYDGDKEVDYYAPLRDKIDDFILEQPDSLEIFISIEYIAGMTRKYLVDTLKKAEKLKERNINVVINWFCESGEEYDRELGEYLSYLCGFSFNFKYVGNIYEHFSKITSE